MNLNLSPSERHAEHASFDLASLQINPRFFLWFNDVSRLAEEVGVSLSLGKTGKQVTTFKVGGPLLVMAEPTDSNQLQSLIKAFSDISLPFRILGAGSNVLIPDRGISFPLIKLKGKEFQELGRECNEELVVGSGWMLPILANRLAKEGIAGLEWAGGIPGTLGGACRMNAGALGRCIADVLTWVEFIDSNGDVQRLNRSDLSMSYREGGTPEGAVVVRAGLQLTQSTEERVNSDLERFREERRSKQPSAKPSAGSVFKNPLGQKSAGALVEEAGLKGLQIGGAQVSDKHGNWIVNLGGATASDVTELVALCQKRVFEKSEILLETEIRLW